MYSKVGSAWHLQALNRLYFPRCPSEVPFPSFRSTTYIHHEANYRRSHHIQRPCLSQLHIHLRRLQTRGTGCFMTLQQWSLTYFTMQPRRRQRRCPRVENGLGFVSLNKDSYTLLGKEWIKEHWPYSLYCLTMGKLNCLPNSLSLAISEASRSYRSFWGVQCRCGEWISTYHFFGYLGIGYLWRPTTFHYNARERVTSKDARERRCPWERREEHQMMILGKHERRTISTCSILPEILHYLRISVDQIIMRIPERASSTESIQSTTHWSLKFAHPTLYKRIDIDSSHPMPSGRRYTKNKNIYISMHEANPNKRPRAACYQRSIYIPTAITSIGSTPSALVHHIT